MSFSEADIFERARQIQSIEARNEFLDQVCPDADVRKRLERLLAKEQDDSFLENPAIGRTALDRGTDPLGTTIGHYKLLEPIGEGGMGTVYLAQQFEPVKRRVALKLIRSGMDSKKVITRFEAERQTLALMEHPNIAKFYDAGTTSSGNPYFVMEYIPGLTVTRYCDENRVPIEDRLQLFRKVCQAVQHSHQKGVIHRDLKPSNILIKVIDDEPVPKIIDFGLAKATGSQLTDNTLLTNFGQILGTLQYMSPEQTNAGGEDIDTRSDIYSLGAILYELLVGSPPFEVDSFKKRALDEVLRMIREEDPPTPKKRLGSSETNTEIAGRRRIEVDKMNRQVKGDLECIVMKSLAKDRNRRYETAHSFELDLMRYLNEQPVEAAPDSALYRIRTFIRRNRVAVRTFMAIMSIITIAASIVFWQRIESQRLVRKQQTEMIVDRLMTGPPEAVPFAIEAIGPFRRYAERRLNAIFENQAIERNERLRASFALAEFGDVKQDFLLQTVQDAQNAECNNYLTALQHAEDFDIGAVRRIANTAKEEKDWQTQSRFAIFALNFGYSSVGQELCRNRPDPIQRTTYMATLPEWHGDLLKLAAVLSEVDDPMLRYSTILGVGAIQPNTLTGFEKRRWRALLVDWFANKADSSTHSAAGWTLRKWNLELPKISVNKHQLTRELDWYLNTNNMTMLLVPAGNFLRTNVSSGEMSNLKQLEIIQKASVSKSFFMCDREVTVAQFQAFVDDSECPAELKPDDWQGAESGISPTKEHPVQMINWHEAVLYCNWLSRREGLSSYYDLQSTNDKNSQKWKFNPMSNGYRLPTEAEWEYASRSGTDTKFSHGNNDLDLDKWAVLGGKLNAAPTGTTMPNAWGFFDMHGNVWEWCSDWHGAYPNDATIVDPHGPPNGTGRVIRGGSFARGPYQAMATHRYVPFDPTKRDSGIGFRVARNYSDQKD